MNIEDLVAVSVLWVLAVFATVDIWVRPRTFLRRQRQRRARAYESWIGFLMRNPYSRGFDRSPGMEILVARAGSLLIYAALVYMSMKVVSR